MSRRQATRRLPDSPNYWIPSDRDASETPFLEPEFGTAMSWIVALVEAPVECLTWILMRLYGIYSARNVCMGSTVAAIHAGRALARAPIARSRAAALT